MSSPSAKSPYAGYRFPPEVISHAVWLYFRFPLSLRMVEEMTVARLGVRRRSGISALVL
jgi:putative transposase